MVKDLWRGLASMPIMPRFAVVGAVISGVVGGTVGLIIGLDVYAPTAWFAVFEIGLPAGILGAALGFLMGGCVLVFRFLRHRQRQRRRRSEVEVAEAPHFKVHLDPVWRERADFIINARIDDSDSFEQLWCRQVAADRFEICCVPFFLYDVALGDVVQTEPERERKYLLSKVVQPSGRYVFRVHFQSAAAPSVARTADELATIGALIEWSSSTLMSVDARDLRHAEEVSALLMHGQSRDDLIYETGKS